MLILGAALVRGDAQTVVRYETIARDFTFTTSYTGPGHETGAAEHAGAILRASQALLGLCRGTANFGRAQVTHHVGSR